MVRTLGGAIGVFFVSAVVCAQNCIPAIAGSPAAPSLPAVGIGPQPTALVNFDDGVNGPRFYTAGFIPVLANSGVLTPSGWQQVGAGLQMPIYTLGVLADGEGPGGGPSLYAGGLDLRRLNEGLWTVVDSPGAVYVAVMYDDRQGDGPALHVVSSSSLYKRVGNTWQIKGTINCLDPRQLHQRVLVFDEDGAGPMPSSIYFTAYISSFAMPGMPNTSPASHMVRWDGQSFTAIPDTFAGSPPTLPSNLRPTAAAIFDDGTGPALYVSMMASTGLTPHSIVRWRSAMQRWEPVGQSVGNSEAANALAVLDDGVGPIGRRLYAFAQFPFTQVQPIATTMAWDGQSWTAIRHPYTLVPLAQQNFPIASGRLGGAQVPGLIAMTMTFPIGLVGCRCRGDVNLDGAMTLGDRAIVMANLGTARSWTGGDLDGNGIVEANDLSLVCAADFNCDASVSAADIVEFLNAWLALAPRADYNGAGGISVLDIFDFFAGWFAGC